MPESISLSSRKELAKTLYISDHGITQKEIAERVGVSEKTIGKWIKNDNWEKLRTSLLLTKEAELARMYEQLRELNTSILKKEEGERYANSKEADTMVKLTSAIKALETDVSAAEAMETLKGLINMVRVEDQTLAKSITKWADIYVKTLLK